jgi:hypothetical protein
MRVNMKYRGRKQNNVKSDSELLEIVVMRDPAVGGRENESERASALNEREFYEYRLRRLSRCIKSGGWTGPREYFMIPYAARRQTRAPASE